MDATINILSFRVTVASLSYEKKNAETASTASTFTGRSFQSTYDVYINKKIERRREREIKAPTTDFARRNWFWDFGDRFFPSAPVMKWGIRNSTLQVFLLITQIKHEKVTHRKKRGREKSAPLRKGTNIKRNHLILLRCDWSRPCRWSHFSKSPRSLRSPSSRFNALRTLIFFRCVEGYFYFYVYTLLAFSAVKRV